MHVCAMSNDLLVPLSDRGVRFFSVPIFTSNNVSGASTSMTSFSYVMPRYSPSRIRYDVPTYLATEVIYPQHFEQKQYHLFRHNRQFSATFSWLYLRWFITSRASPEFQVTFSVWYLETKDLCFV